MINLVLLFGPGQIAWIILWTLIIILFIVTNQPLYGILTVSPGAMIAFVGQASQTAETRYTLGQLILYDGIELVAMLIGLFAPAEIIRISSLDRNTIIDFDKIKMVGSVGEGGRAVFSNKFLWFKSSMIRLVVGAVPDAGGSAAAFICYAQAAQTSKNADQFGKGAFKGIIAPEAANDAKDGGQLFPTLGLGVPGSGTMTIFLGAMLMHGIFPGPQVPTEETHLILVIAIALLISNILTSVFGLLVAERLTAVLRVLIPLLLTGITVLALTAVFIVRGSPIDVFIALAFAVLGVILIYLKISRVPFLIGSC